MMDATLILIDSDVELARALVDGLWDSMIRPMLRGWRHKPA